VTSRASDPSELLFWCAVGFVAGIGLFFYGFRLLQRRRLILDTPFSKIRSASIGMVEVSGLAVGPYTMIAPITARACYYYRTLVSEWKQQGKNKQWVRIAGECMHVPFFLDDNTGRVLVDPRGADLDLYCDFREEFNGSFFSSRDDAPGNVDSFLARHGIVTSNRIKVEEYCIKPKNSLFILGTLTENPGLTLSPQPVLDDESLGNGVSVSLGSFSFTLNTSGNDRDGGALVRQLAAPLSPGKPQVVRLYTGSGPLKTTDMTQQQKVAAALLKAGISNPAAWEAAGVNTADATSPDVQVMAGAPLIRSGENGNGLSNDSAPATSTEGFDPHPSVVLKRGENNKTFLISWRSQREVASSLGWKCTLMIWGGPVLALISLYFFLGIRNLF